MEKKTKILLGFLSELFFLAFAIVLIRQDEAVGFFFIGIVIAHCIDYIQMLTTKESEDESTETT